MVKKPPHTEDAEAPKVRKSSGQSAMPPPRREQNETETMNLIELRPGLFINVNHIVSVRVLPQEEANAYAILQLSNGDKQDLSRDEFTEITGAEPRQAARLPQNHC